MKLGIGTHEQLCLVWQCCWVDVGIQWSESSFNTPSAMTQTS